MPMRRLGRTNLTISALALGTVELGLDYGIAAPGHYGRPSEQEAIHLVHTAIAHGITLIDTARAYGAAETVLGRALRGRRDQVVLASKVATQAPGGAPRTGDELRRHMLASLDESLTELQTDHVDIWQIHNVDQGVLDQTEVIAEVFADARQAGKIRFSGGSFYGVDLPLAALAHNLFDVMQITYSVFDQRLADSFFGLAAAADIGILARSVLLKGALTERAEHLPERLQTLRLRSRAFRTLVAEALPGITPAQAAIAFALAQPAIHAVLIGIRTEDELLANLPSLTVQVTARVLAQLTSLRVDDPDLLNPGTWGIP